MRIPAYPLPMRLFGAATLLLLVAAFAFPPHRVLNTTLRIAAPPSRVWAVLVDTADYPRWNPFMRLSGPLLPGRVIEHVELDGDDRTVFHPRLLVVRPDRELRWLGRIALPRLLDAEHVILLRPDGQGTLLMQGERLRGVGVWLLDTDALRTRFEATNKVLRKRVESCGGGGPTSC